MDKTKLTPMLQQYLSIKENTNDALVFYRLGDFYELFFEDAITASKVLDLVLTARAAGGDQKAPMCGVPHHAAKSYIQKLVLAGYKVAIVEQVEDPKEVKGIVKREVVEIVTPGTFFDTDDNETREIASIHADLVYASIAFCNLVNGSLRALRVMNEPVEIIKALNQFQVKEIVVAENFDEHLIQEIESKTSIVVSYENQIDSTVSHQDPAFQIALARLSEYLKETQKKDLTHLSDVVVLNDEAYLRMDYSSMTNLELLDHQNDKNLSLYSFLNKTHTNMGARALKTQLMQPFVNLKDIHERHQHIEILHQDFMLNERFVEGLKETYDIHRVEARLSTNKHNAQDFVRLKKTLKAFEMLQNEAQSYVEFDFITEPNPLLELANTLDEAIFDDAPVALKEGRTFKPGIHQELDRLVSLTKDGKKWLLEYESTQRELTGIKNLKVGYTRAFGYYIEISKGQIENVKEEFGYIRKQTLTNAERYISEALQNYEVESLQASDRILEIENDLFNQYTQHVLKHAKAIHDIADAIAHLDVVVALAEISMYPGYTKPRFVDGKVLDIRGGKHPVLHQTLTDHQYIASDALLNENHWTQILTGPNMGGKSTYMRMVALNVILAHIGSYVAADAMTLSLVDQIFTRMGASDDILLGQSTFMVEMMESQAALTKATEKSLVLFDEIGRGTSTYDGMALAQAIIEYINNTVKARTIFSTHYHELVALESMFEGIVNVHVEVHEENDHVTFLYRVVEGRADKSYGINVARLAHLPESIIERATQNLELLEMNKEAINLDTKLVQIEVEPQSYTRIKNHLSNVNVDHLTPMEALILVSELKSYIGSEE